MFWFGCSDDEGCDAQIACRPCEGEHDDRSTHVSDKSGRRTGATTWMELFDVIDHSTSNVSCNAVLHHGGSRSSMHSPTHVDELESSASSVVSSCTIDSDDERCTSPTSSSTGSDVEWQASGAQHAHRGHLLERSRSSSAASSSSVDVGNGDPPLLYGAAAHSGALSHEQRQTSPHAAPARRSHPSFEEWRAEKLDDASLKEAFFGVGHKCTNLWNGKGCHVNLWGDAHTGLQALKAQRV